MDPELSLASYFIWNSDILLSISLESSSVLGTYLRVIGKSGTPRIDYQ